ncbi:DUF1963 domain-containing protein [Actinomadura rupiterrae]|uniref:DUF1963 domain-containing protein n=1 Tax=Actinomadura rupiterrae TaxID=559627 RepID=UPI0020A3686E|nr:YwqG family protein [Actinomadura rupiterrae]MCP2342765.1 uncharacterized protein YwqG [Actinomadura rupiterrae]
MIDLEEELIQTARRHLPPDAAEEWIRLMRPAINLRSRKRGTEPVGHLGGLPALPSGMAWPAWNGDALNFVASLDCARLPIAALDLPLPAEGTLLFFCIDAEDDRFEIGEGPSVDVGVPESMAGMRVLHLPPGVEVTERQAPAGLRPFERVELGARLLATGPDTSQPELRAAVRRLGGSAWEALEDREYEEGMYNAVLDRLPRHWHWLGGHAKPKQDAVELDAAYTAFAGEVGWADPRLEREALRWRPLAQFDSDEAAGMKWSDIGTIYFLVRPEDLAARRFDAASLTVQH